MQYVILLALLVIWLIARGIKSITQSVKQSNKPTPTNTPGYERARELSASGLSRKAEQTITIKAPPPISPEDFFQKHLTAYVSFDLETTGLDAESCRIIEIGAVKVHDGLIVDTFQTFVNPGRGRHIPPEATAINHITDEMVASAPFYGTAIPSFVKFIEDLPLVAHNAVFDIKFMYAAFSELDIPKPLLFTDSLKMARQCFPGLPNKKLGTVCDHIGYQIVQAHRALDDAKAVHAIVQACASAASDKLEVEKAYQLHMKLSTQIEDQYKFVQEYTDRADEQMDAILALCYQDFGLVDQARRYCELCGWPEPAFHSFNRAIIILTKRKDFDAAISVCQQAIDKNIPYPSLPGGMAERKEKLVDRKNANAQKERRLQEQTAAREARKAKQEKKKAAAENKSPSPGNKRPVLKLSFDGTAILKEYESVASAAKEMEIDKSCIRDAANGKQKHAAGFTWKYADEYTRVDTSS